MFSDYFPAGPPLPDPAAALARQRRQREVENALLSYLMGGFKPDTEALAALQQYIEGQYSREKAFRALYEVH